MIDMLMLVMPLVVLLLLVRVLVILVLHSLQIMPQLLLLDLTIQVKILDKLLLEAQHHPTLIHRPQIHYMYVKPIALLLVEPQLVMVANDAIQRLPHLMLLADIIYHQYIPMLIIVPMYI